MYMFQKFILRNLFLYHSRFFCTNFHIPNEIKIPNKVFRDNTSVLKALGNCFQLEPKSIRYSLIDDANLNISNIGLQRASLLSKASGKLIARQVFEEKKMDFMKVADDIPKIKSLMPLIPTTDILKKVKKGILSPDKGLLLMINLLKPQESWEFYMSNSKDISYDCKLNLLELLCAVGNIENFNTEIPCEEIFLLDPNVYEWKTDNQAEILFRSLPNKNERSFESMIYGASKFKNHTRALELFYEMRQIHPDYFLSVGTCNSLLRSLQSIPDNSQTISHIMEIFTGMTHYNISPDVFTFNNSFFALSQKPLPESDSFCLSLYNEMKYLNIEPNLGTFSALLQCKFSRKQLSTLIIDIIEILEKRRHEQIFEEIHSEDDGKLFSLMSKIIYDSNSPEIGLRLQKIVIQGGNLPLLASNFEWGNYSNNFCRLLIRTETDLDVIFRNLKYFVPYFYQLSSSSVNSLISMIGSTHSHHLIPDLINLVQWFKPKMIKTDSFYRMIQLILKQIDFSVEQPILKSRIIDSFYRLFEILASEFRVELQPNAIGLLIELLKRFDDEKLLWNYIDWMFDQFYIVPSIINDLMEMFHKRKQILSMIDLLRLFCESIDSQNSNGESAVFNWLKNEKESMEKLIDYSKGILPGLLMENNIAGEDFEKLMFRLTDTLGRLKEFQISEISEGEEMDSFDGGGQIEGEEGEDGGGDNS